MPAFPITFPAITPAKIEFTAKTGTSLFTSPFTYTSQTIRYQGAQIWQLNLTFASLTATDAQNMSGFLTACAGTSGTFWFTIPSKYRLPGNVGISVSANGNDVTITSGAATVGLYGADNTYNRLCMFTTPTSIFPALPNTTTTIVPGAGALFRLASGQAQWSVDEMMEFAFTIAITEAI
jgi:hypothetical protein